MGGRVWCLIEKLEAQNSGSFIEKRQAQNKNIKNISKLFFILGALALDGYKENPSDVSHKPFQPERQKMPAKHKILGRQNAFQAAPLEQQIKLSDSEVENISSSLPCPNDQCRSANSTCWAQNSAKQSSVNSVSTCIN